MTDRLTSHTRADGKGVITDEENPNAWMVFGEDAIITDTALESRPRTGDWTLGRPDSHPSPRTDVDDWELKD